MSRLANKVIIVTGASSGIGEATAIALGSRGANVVITARRADRLNDLVGRIVKAGGHAVAVPGDITDRATAQNVVDTAMTDFKRVDVLINNAGIMPLAPLRKCRVDEWDAMIDVNIKGLLYGIAAALPKMIEQKTGHIVSVSSVAGRRVFPNGAVYCATKHAVHAIRAAQRAGRAGPGRRQLHPRDDDRPRRGDDGIAGWHPRRTDAQRHDGLHQHAEAAVDQRRHCPFDSVRAGVARTRGRERGAAAADRSASVTATA